VAVVASADQLIGGGRLKGLDLVRYELNHGPDPFQVGEDVAFALLVIDTLTVHEDLHDSLSSRRYRHSYIGSELSEEFIRHPRGGSEMLSSYAVSDLYLSFSFHNGPPQQDFIFKQFKGNPREVNHFSASRERLSDMLDRP